MRDDGSQRVAKLYLGPHAGMTTSWQAAHDLAMSLPDVEEHDHFGSPSYRVGGKIFAQLSAANHQAARALVKLSSAEQAALTMSDPETFSSEPSWGRHGWTYAALATVDASMLHDLLLQSWRLVARKNTLLPTKPAANNPSAGI